MNKEHSSGISAVIGIVILILLVLVLSAGVLFAAQTLVGDQPQQMVGGMTEERISPYEQRVSLVSQGNANNLTVVSPLGTEYNLSQVGDSQLYLAVSSSVSGAQDPQILGVKNGERQVLTSSGIRDGIPADAVVDKHGTGDYTSIQSALNDAQPGDIVVVEKATYNENIDVPPNASLIAEHGTVLQDQNPAEPVISINNGNATIMNFIIDADPVPGDNHYASHGIFVNGKNTEIIGNTIRNATSPAGDSAGLRVESNGVVARYNNFKNNEFSLSVSSGVGSVQLCSNQLDGGLHGSFSKSTYETFVMRNYWNKGVPSTVLNNVLSDRTNVTATDVSRNAVNFNKVFETSNDQEILAAKAFPGTRLFGGAPCGIQLSFTNQGSSVNVVNASISYEIKNVTYNVTFNEDYSATLTRGNNSTTTSYSVSGGDTSWDTGESLSLASPDSGSSDTSGVWGSGGGGGGGASFWGGGTGGGLSGGSLFGSGGGASFWGVSSGTTSSDVKVTKSPTNNTTASVEQSPPENVTETEKQNVTVDLGADFKATVGDEIGLDAVVTGGTSPYNYTWTLGDGTTSYSKSVTHIYDSTGNYTISLNVTDANGQNDTDSITVWIQESTTTTKTKNETLTLNEQVNNLSAGETLVIPSGSYSSVNVYVPGVTLVGDGSVTIDGLSILSDNVKVKSVEVTGPLSVTGSDYSMYDSTIDNTGGAWAIEVYKTGAYFDGVTGEANNGMYVARALQDIQFTGGSLIANSGQGVLVKKHTGIVEITDSSVTATGAGIYREHGSQLYLTRNSISGSPNVERILNKPPQPAFTYNDAPLDNGSYGVKFDPSPTTDPESEPITSMKWDFDNDGTWDAYGEGVKQYTYPGYGTYNVTLAVTDYHGVTVNLEREITINEYYFAVSTNKSTVNTSDPVEFNVTTSVSDSNIDHYNIDYDGDGTAEEQVSSMPVTYTFSAAGNYTSKIELVTTNSGVLANTTDISIFAPPEAVIAMNQSGPSVDETILFDASGSYDPDGGSLTYIWEFGDGKTKTGEVVTHNYSSKGDYAVTLTVKDNEGQTGVSTEVVNVIGSTSKVIDNFEDSDLSEYSVIESNYGIVSSPVHEGSYALRQEHDTGDDHRMAYSFSGLDYYPSPGDTFTVWFREQSGDGDADAYIGFGLQNENTGTTNTFDNGYWINLDHSNNDLSILKDSRNGLSTNSSVTLPTDEWYSVTIHWGVGGEINATLGNGASGTVSVTDTTYSSQGGIGFSSNRLHAPSGSSPGDVYFDYYNAGNIWSPSQPVAQYAFEQNTSDIINGYDGVDKTDTGYESGPVGRYSKVFDGTDDYVEIADSPGLTFSNSLSIMTWVKPDTLEGGERVVSKYYYSSMSDAGGYQIVMNQDGTFDVYLRNDGDTVRVTTSKSIPTSSWSLIGFTWDGSTVQTYINNSKTASGTYTGTIKDTTYPLRIARFSEDQSGTFFDGQIDDVRLYDTAIPDSDIQFLYNNKNIPPVSKFVVSTDNTTVGESITFDASSSVDSDGSIDSYKWDFNNDGNIEKTGSTVSYTYSSEGNYTATLTVTDNGNKSSTSTQEIQVNPIIGVPDSGLVGYWPLNESSGASVAEDYGPGGYDGSVNGPESGVVVNGVRSYRFSSSDAISLPKFALDNTNNGLTLSFWVNPDFDTTSGSGKQIFRWKDSGSDNTGAGWAKTHGGPGDLNFEWSDDGMQYDVPTNYQDNWKHITMVANDQDPVTLKIYVDGQLVKSGGVSGRQTMTGSVPSRIGHGGGQSFVGEISEFRIYDHSLTESEVKALFTQTGINAPPKANFSVNSSEPVVGETIEFDASTTLNPGGGSLTYEWDFDNDDAIEETGEIITHSYSTSGEHMVTLTVTNSEGKTSTTMKTISVTEPGPSLTWKTASDWDNAASQTGVIHESVPNTDNSDPSVLKKGYTAQPNDPSLVGYYPLQEDSGNTAYDFSSVGDNGTAYGGAGPSGTGTINGPSGTTAWEFDGTDDDIQGMNHSGVPYSVAFWTYPHDISNKRTILEYAYNYPNGGYLIRFHNGNFQVYNPAGSHRSVSATANTWQFWAVTIDNNDNCNIYRNGNLVKSAGVSSGTLGTGQRIGSEGGGYFDGAISNLHIYNQSLSSAEVGQLYSAAGGTSSITTATKAFSESSNPDLETAHSLNGQSITVTVTGSPGTTDSETETVSLDSSSTYNLTWSQNHTEYQVKIELGTSDPTQTPTLNRIKLVSTDHPPQGEELSPPTEGLVAHWKFDGNGTDSKNGYDLSTTGLTYSSGVINQSASFESDGDGATYSNTVLSSPTSVTVAGWVKLGDITSHQQLFRSHPADWKDFGVEYNRKGNQKIAFELATTDYTSKKVYSSSSPSADTWVHFTAVYNGSSNRQIIYLDGEHEGARDRKWSNNIGGLTFGHDHKDNNHLQGSLDDIRVYDRALNTTEISTLYNATR